MDFVLVLAILVAVVVVISAPFRSRPDATPERVAELADLEAARQAKYRELRDAELDHRTGKLSDPDYQAVDSELRAEAIEILRALDRTRVDQVPEAP